MALETLHTDFEEISEDLGAIGVMGEDGDTKHIWKTSSKAEVAEARLLFDTLTAKGYRAYQMSKGGRKGNPLKDFDELLGQMTFLPPKGAKVSKDPPHVLMVPPFAGG